MEIATLKVGDEHLKPMVYREITYREMLNALNQYAGKFEMTKRRIAIWQKQDRGKIPRYQPTSQNYKARVFHWRTQLRNRNNGL